MWPGSSACARGGRDCCGCSKNYRPSRHSPGRPARVVGDRGYGRAGQVLDVGSWLGKQAAASSGACVRWVNEQGHHSAGRLIAAALSPAAAERARAKARRYASKHQQRAGEDTLRLRGWLLVFTSLPQADWSTQQILDLYRVRWQIELVIKRMKQVLKLAQLRGKLTATHEAVLLS